MQIIKKYSHTLIIPLYAAFYLISFIYLENTNHINAKLHIIHMRIDDYIPFCEFFIIPYLLWFLYVAACVVYFIFQDRQEYYRMIVYLFTGMTIFLAVSYFYPNGHHLRPTEFTRDNIFIDMVRSLYSRDTSTNVLPSIHVFNSIVVHTAFAKNKGIQKRPWLLHSSFVLMVLIIMATVFLKQHSMMDVITGILMAAVLYIPVYKFEYSALRARAQVKREEML